MVQYFSSLAGFISFITVGLALKLIRTDALQTFQVGPTSLRLEPLYIKVVLTTYFSVILGKPKEMVVIFTFFYFFICGIFDFFYIFGSFENFPIFMHFIVSILYPGLPHLLEPDRPRDHPSLPSHLSQHCHLQTGVSSIVL